MRGSFALTSSAFVAITIVACATAGGEFNAGTEKFDAAPPPAPGPAAAAECTIESGSGEKWSDLYRDIFGPTSRPGSCSFASFCHGDPDHSGAKSSNFICSDQVKCRETLVANGWITDADKADPSKSAFLAGLLRLKNPDGSFRGFMPEQPGDCFFSDASVARVSAWIANGFPND